MEANAEERERLVEAGYSADLWDWNADIAIEVETQEAAAWRLRLDQAYTARLLECYREYVGILRDLHITEITIHDASVPIGSFVVSTSLTTTLSVHHINARVRVVLCVVCGVSCVVRVVTDQVFVEGLPLEELKGRRTLAIQHMHRRVTAAPATAQLGGGPAALSPEEKAGFAARKCDLLGREEALEKEWARERQKKENPRKATKKAQRTRVSCRSAACRVVSSRVVCRVARN
jgi:hypothetical protein